ncbi:MAG: hypothetical protein Q4G66_08860 [bacterium]|nr:hypothetical protein [bacterium]
MNSMDKSRFPAVYSFVEQAVVDGKKALRVTKDPQVKAFDEPTFARLVGSEFKDGVIEVQVLSRLLPDAPDFARGFIGLAFRIDASNTHFECLYIRPVNGRVQDQVQRNHATQYFSYPDFKFDRLRQEANGKYESYADMRLDEWIPLKIEVQGETAKLFLYRQEQPVLVVQDLKRGADVKGAIGLWVDVGTEGYFTDLKITDA